jgi:hypothetical protein
MKCIKTVEELDNYAKRKFVNILYTSSTFYPSSLDFDTNKIARFRTEHMRRYLLNRHNHKMCKFIIIFNNLLIVSRTLPIRLYEPITQFYSL